MARNTVITVALVIASLFLAIALFIAGAVWRGRVTSGNANCSPRPGIEPTRFPVYPAGFLRLIPSIGRRRGIVIAGTEELLSHEIRVIGSHPTKGCVQVRFGLNSFAVFV